MELKKHIIEYNEKKAMHTFFFESDEGKLFYEILKDMQSERLDVAQSAYLTMIQPNEQIIANVHQAGGIKAVIDFIDSIHNEVEAKKKEEEKK